jgi:hypothetical protein
VSQKAAGCGGGEDPPTELRPLTAECYAMALWGEGDPRWQVSERTDGTNVNNWHW